MVNKKRLFLIIGTLFIFNFFILKEIFFGAPRDYLAIYALDVGQGDSELIIFPGGVKVLVDGGPAKGNLIKKLESIIPVFDRYIDLVILTHPETDHFSGLIDVFKNYKVGGLITNGKDGSAKSFLDFKEIIKESKNKEIFMASGDNIIYGGNIIKFLSPFKSLKDFKASNEMGLTFLMESGGLRALFMADVGEETEKELILNNDLNIDILKIGHHGSKFSSSEEFLKTATPIISLIEVGAKNSYGHPTEEVLNRLKNINSKIYRTDLNGVIKIVFKDNKLSILSEK